MILFFCWLNVFLGEMHKQNGGGQKAAKTPKGPQLGEAPQPHKTKITKRKPDPALG